MARSSFNSKLVRLKDCPARPEEVGNLTFQFQTGAIKRADHREREDDCAFEFQFQTGAIKSATSHCKRLCLFPVSIPNWCD